MRRAALVLLSLAALTAPASPVLAQADTNSGDAAPQASAAVCAAPVAAAHVRCFARVRLARAGGPVLHGVTAASVGGYGPADLQSAYAIGAAGGRGQTVAVVDVGDDPNAEADLAVYRASYGLSACTSAGSCFRKVNMNGAATPDAGWSQEISLDLDMVSASCPNCAILLVEVPQDQTGSASVQTIMQGVNLAIQLGAREVSLSLGAGEFGTETLSDPQLNRAGVTVTVASGDSGYGTSYPATSPYVVAVGGTTLRRAGNARGWSETVWAGTGSGCSAYEPKPAWQHDGGCARRTDNDVTVVADPQSGVAVYDTYLSGGWLALGGTSVGAPLVAGIAADGGGLPGGGAQTLYSSPATDMVSGSNGTCSPAYLCTAGVGYDGPSGVGSPWGAMAPPPPAPTSGYWLVAADGGIFPFGTAAQGLGSTGNMRLNQPIVGMARTPSGRGYWLVAADGGIFPFGDAAQGLGSTGNLRLNQPIVGMASTPDGGGYWLVAADGGIFPFGDAAQGLGSAGGMRLNRPIVGMASTPSGRGYWLVASDGGIFPFGDAAQGLGSTGNMRLNQPIVGMASTPDGGGYWLVAADGGIFPFGDATQGLGSTGGTRLNQPIVGMAATPSGRGYWLVASDGGIFPFGDAGGWGSTGNLRLNRPIVGMSPTP
ncbi:MAG TPA: S8 family serine peptidase [Candidatus Angelobacter sp.]|nr:S8 family serine peptidase [Candidatus Angelobacter sp.]